MADSIRYVLQDKYLRYVDQDLLFSYYGFDWVTAPSGEGILIVYWVMAAAAGFMALGLLYRLSAAVFFLSFTYIFLLDQAQYLNHFYLIALLSFLLIFVPAHRAFSLDALLWRKRASDEAPAWALWIFRAELAIVYVYAAMAKVNVDWLLRGEPLRTWMASRTGLPFLGPLMTDERIVWLFVYGGFLLDLAIVPALLWRRTRPLALVFVTLFHLTNAVMFDIGVFPWLMLAATTVFLEPDWARKLAYRLFGPARRPWRRLQTANASLLPLMAVFILWQLFFPLRHWAYPGDVNWTEEGHRFSWRMKLRQKESIELTFTLVDSTSGTGGYVMHPGLTLTGRQIDSMETRPDMILQFAHYIADQREEAIGERPQIFVKALTSLNGRPAQDLIDPAVDLAAEPRTLGHAHWIVPLTKE